MCPDRALSFRILDLAGAPGELSGRLLADMGADVVKIEPPGGDPARLRGPFYRDEPDPERSLSFIYANTNKRGITLDITAPSGQATLKALVKTADAVIESYPVGYLAGLGLGYNRLSETNPSIVMTSVTPFGQTGPYRGWKGSDIVHWALGGPLYLSGLPDRPPLNAPGQAYAYSAIDAAIGTLAALWARSTAGTGQHVDIAVHESVVFITPETGVSKYLDDLIAFKRAGNKRPGMTPVGLFKCQDGHVCIGAGTAAQWDRLAQWIHEVTGDETALADIFKGPVAVRYLYEEIVVLLVESLTARYTKDELCRVGRQRDIPVTPVNTVADAVASDLLSERGFWQPVSQPGIGQVSFPGAPYLFSATPSRLYRPAPKIGEHNDDVYLGELGLSKSELAGLIASGVV